jgi:hypothetical protein
VEHITKPDTGCVAVDGEDLVEVRHLEDGSRREGVFKPPCPTRRRCGTGGE